METIFDTTKAAALIAGNLTTAIYVRLMIAAFKGEADVATTIAGSEVATTNAKMLRLLAPEQDIPKP